MKVRLESKKSENPDIVSFFFAPDEKFDFIPGQFLRYHLPNPKPDERGENRFFSIASAPSEKAIRLTSRFTKNQPSAFKTDLAKLKVGDSIEAFGPSGSFTIRDSNLHHVFIAGGIGITPFRSILLDLGHRKKPINITLLYANRTKEIIFKDELESLAKKNPEFKIYYIISDESTAKQQLTQNVKILPGKIDETLTKSLIFDLQSSIYYISGPEPMVLNVVSLLVKIGIPKENIKRDEFPGYKNY